MAPISRSNRALLAGLGLSLAIHLSALLGIGRLPLVANLAAAIGLPQAPPPVETAKAPLPDTDVLALGIAESDAVTVNWIGYTDPTEHHANEGPTDQPQVSINPGTEAEQTVASAAAPEPAPATVPDQAPSPTPDSGDPDPADITDVPDIGELLANLNPVMDQLRQLASNALAGSPLPATVSAPQTRPQAPAQADAGSGAPGEASDRESDASAIIGTIEVRPGHPAAAKGLEIKTVRPNWPNLVRMTSTPDNPLVIIKFKRSGQVFEANFEPGESTGSKAVDGPLLDAIYAWRASGEALRRLSPTDPDATLEVRIRVILR